MPKNISRRKFVARSIRLAIFSQLIPLERLEAAAQTARLPAVERRTLRAAIDVIVPAEGRMPAASAVGAVGYLDRMAAADSGLRELLMDGLRAMEVHSRQTAGAPFTALGAEQQYDVLAHFEQADSTKGFFIALRDAVYEAYYTQPRIWKLLGYNFRSSRRRTARLEPLDEKWVARVREMAPLYREVR